MKILFISDIHGIATNLNVIEKKIKNEKIDKLVCLGDLYYAGPSYDNKYKIVIITKKKQKIAILIFIIGCLLCELIQGRIQRDISEYRCYYSTDCTDFTYGCFWEFAQPF